MMENESKHIERGRFAPSPTGRMHLGNVFAALMSWLSVRSKGGEWLLRIEDIDPDRSRRSYADQLMADLEWLGLGWDGQVVWQSQRSDIYEQYCQQLRNQGLTYPCVCTRADILATQAPHESDGRVVYKGTCRNRSWDESPAATRLRVDNSDIVFTDGHYGEQRVNMERQVGDFIIRRKDGAWAYQLAVVVDDALMGITEVVRGRDLLLSSPQQMYLARLLGFAPPCFTHFPLLVNEAGQRLSKRDHAMNLGLLRERYTAKEIIGRLAWLAGQQDSPDPVSAESLINRFSWEKVPIDDIRMEEDVDECNNDNN